MLHRGTQTITLTDYLNIIISPLSFKWYRAYPRIPMAAIKYGTSSGFLLNSPFPFRAHLLVLRAGTADRVNADRLQLRHSSPSKSYALIVGLLTTRRKIGRIRNIAVLCAVLSLLVRSVYRAMTLCMAVHSCIIQQLFPRRRV